MESTTEGDDDEKQPLQHDTLSADELLSEFMKSRELIEQQERRLMQIDDEDHLNDLMLHQFALSVESLIECLCAVTPMFMASDYPATR